MPDKDPNSWFALWRACPEPVKASIFAGVIALVRAMYDDKEPRFIRRVLESLLCGLITFAVGYGVAAMGYESGVQFIVGGAVGLLGADYVRALGRRFAEHKASGRG